MKGEVHIPSILVLMIAVDEEDGIGLTIGELERKLGHNQILVVDGFSKDGTAEIARKMGAEVIFRERKGKGDAFAYALNNLKEDFDYLVLIDADYTYPAEFIPQMIKIMQEDPSLGLICGNRFNSHFHTEKINDVFYLGNRLLALTHNVLNGITMRDPLSGLRVIRWEILKNWKPKSKGFDIEVEMNHYIEKQGYGIKEVDIAYRARIGEKKLKAHHGLQILKRMITEVKS